MAEKNNKFYKSLFEFIEEAESDVKKYYPTLWEWYSSPLNHVQREKLLDKALADDNFRRELYDIDEDNEFTELLDSNKGDENAEVLGVDKTPIEDVNAWYDAAKKSIDPTNVLKNTELYDTAGDKTFFQLEDMNGDLDWFAKLAQDLGYPDTYEGYNQLEQDFKTVLNRKRNADKAEKYGGVVDFAMGNSMNTLNQGFKPTIGDIVSDAVANIAWTIPGMNFTKAVEAVSPATRLYQASKALDRGHKSFGIGTRLASKTVENSTAPIINEVSKALMTSNVPDGSNEASMKNVLRNSLTNAAIMKLIPGTLRMAELVGDGMGMKPGEMSRTVDKALVKSQKISPELSSYLINRAGNDNVAGWLFNRITKPAESRFGVGKDEESK